METEKGRDRQKLKFEKGGLSEGETDMRKKGEREIVEKKGMRESRGNSGGSSDEQHTTTGNAVKQISLSKQATERCLVFELASFCRLVLLRGRDSDGQRGVKRCADEINHFPLLLYVYISKRIN